MNVVGRDICIFDRNERNSHEIECYLLCLEGEVVVEGVFEGADVFFGEEDGLSDALDDGRRDHQRPLRPRFLFNFQYWIIAATISFHSIESTS